MVYIATRGAYCSLMANAITIQGKTAQYDLVRVGERIECTCPAYAFSGEKSDCKHLAALRTLTGLPFNMSVTACIDQVCA